MRVKNPNIETIYQKVVNLYNSGITDCHKIANILDAKESTTRSYVSIARKNGDIKKISLYKQVVDTYNSGITDPNDIAEKLGISNNTVQKYMKLGIEQKLINPVKSLYMKVIEMYYSGIVRYKEIATNLEISVETVKHYILRARKEGLIPPRVYKNSRAKKKHSEQQKQEDIKEEQEKTENQKQEKNPEQQKQENIKQEQQKRGEIKPKQEKAESKKEENPEQKKQEDIKQESLEEKIRRELIEYVYPKEVARILRIKTWQVYQYMENLSEEEAKKLRKDRLKNNKLYDVVVLYKKKEKEKGNTGSGVVEKILYDMKKNLIDVETRINLARIYFILENGKVAEKILREMYYDTSYRASDRGRTRIELEKVQLENLAIKLKNEYKNGHNMDGTNISYDDLCRRYNVRTREIVDVLGMESIEPER